MKNVLTYGTFDLFHIGHLRLLERAKDLGDRLIVAVSTDEFNLTKGKTATRPFEERCDIVASLRCVDVVIPEMRWDQKKQDILDNNISIFTIGDDWTGKFDHLKEFCDVVYLDRTEGISTTYLKRYISDLAFHQVSGSAA
jgi:glycerol-3-phosphate cytidylyltransferase